MDTKDLNEPIRKGRKRFCPECEDVLKKETEMFLMRETTYWKCFNLVNPSHNDLPLRECEYKYKASNGD